MSTWADWMPPGAARSKIAAAVWNACTERSTSRDSVSRPRAKKLKPRRVSSQPALRAMVTARSAA
jgi:hypothetical protein